MCAVFSKNPVHSTGNVYLALFRAGESEGGEVEEWHPISVLPLQVKICYPTATSPHAKGNLSLSL